MQLQLSAMVNQFYNNLYFFLDSLDHDLATKKSCIALPILELVAHSEARSSVVTTWMGDTFLLGYARPLWACPRSQDSVQTV